jgi:hypothetical protein
MWLMEILNKYNRDDSINMHYLPLNFTFFQYFFIYILLHLEILNDSPINFLNK